MTGDIANRIAGSMYGLLVGDVLGGAVTIRYLEAGHVVDVRTQA
jgi:ADP-ribosylglycohydrolase